LFSTPGSLGKLGEGASGRYAAKSGLWYGSNKKMQSLFGEFSHALQAHIENSACIMDKMHCERDRRTTERHGFSVRIDHQFPDRDYRLI